MSVPSSILAWKIPWMEEPGRLLSIPFQLESESESVSCSVYRTAHVATEHLKFGLCKLRCTVSAKRTLISDLVYEKLRGHINIFFY